MKWKNVFGSIFIVFLYINGTAQTIQFSGKVINNKKSPLAYANIVAENLKDSTQYAYSISDDSGKFRLNLLQNKPYLISISYLGYRSVTFSIESDKNIRKIIALQESPFQLDEVSLKLPVNIKEDTISYSVGTFLTGEERKLKNIIEKLPGLEINDQGIVRFQGQKINKLLVEGKTFFNGNTKLGTDNIPASAIAKIEVIENYNEIKILKGLISSDKLALNVILKEDKKKFIFGDLEGGYGTKQHHRTHNNVFYYHPKTTFNLIGNINNLGEPTMTFNNYVDFAGGLSSVFRKNVTDLSNTKKEFNQFLNKKEALQSNQQFAAVNSTKTVSKNLELTSYIISSNLKDLTGSQTKNTYELFDETIQQENKARRALMIGNISLEYNPDIRNELYLKTHFLKTSFYNQLNILRSNNHTFNSLNNSTNNKEWSLTQIFEWHRNISNNHSLSLALSIKNDKNSPIEKWASNKRFPKPFINTPFNNTFEINQKSRKNRASASVLLNHYWTFSKNHHIYSSLGYTNSSIRLFQSNDALYNNTISQFSNIFFDNEFDYSFNNTYISLHYKVKLGIAEFKQGIVLDRINWLMLNPSNNKSETRLLPDFLASFKFSNSKKLKFGYQFKSKLPDSDLLYPWFAVQNYNSLFRGNPNLDLESFHVFNLIYNHFSLNKGTHLFSIINFNKKDIGVQKSIQFLENSYLIQPELLHNPEENLRVNISFSKKIKKTKSSLSIHLNNSVQKQRTNGLLKSFKTNMYSYDLKTTTLFKNAPNIKIGFRQSFGLQKTKQTKSQFTTSNPYFSITIPITKDLNGTLNYAYNKHTNMRLKQSNAYDMANASLFYKKKDSPWYFTFSMQNILNTKFISSDIISTFLISSHKNFISPRRAIVSIGFDL